MRSSGLGLFVASNVLATLAERSRAEPFKGFRCWSHAEVGETMHREAATPSRAVLLATHQPPRIRRVTVTRAGSYGSDELVAQEDVLGAVMAEGDKSLIVPVIGAPGTGKSHLVLWMKARLDDENAPNRKIIYVPKGETSLSVVIERILDGRTGSPFDEMRAAVAKATRDMSPEEAARRLRNELAVAASNINPASGPPGSEPLRTHIKETIADLLDDPAYADRLVGEGRPLRLLVQQALAGGSEEPAELKPGDLDIGLTAVELEDLSRPAKTLLGDLQHGPLHDAAIEVLNEVRDRCLSRIFGVEPMQLVAVMRELRTKLFEENPALELVLMIEDFTLLQGIQHDLLEAAIELPVRGGKQVMCGMTTVMAVTDGFFTGMLASNDTLRTRIADMGHVYNLDVPYGDKSGGLDREAVTQFTGRYLNAVRAGTQAINEASPTVPNACDHCAHRDRCHDSFGTSGEGEYGLYPFNEAAIDRVIRSRQETFNPRDALTALAQTLTVHAAELREGRFPSAGWMRLFDPRQFGQDPLPTLSLRTQEQVDSLPKPEQRTVLLTFWGGAQDSLVNLPPGVHEAFDIPRVDDAAVVVPRALTSPEKAAQPVAQEDDGIERLVHAWRDGARLEGESQRTLRRVFREAIIAALDSEDALYSPQLVNEVFPSPQYVDIERAGGAGRPQAGKFRVEFDPSNEHALLFVGVLRAQRLESWNFDDGPAAMESFLTRVEVEAAQLKTFIEDGLAARAADHAAATVLLSLSGLAAGHGTAADARGLLAAAIGVGATVSDEMPDRWKALLSQCDQRRPIVRAYALQASHVSKSTSEPMAIDATQLLPALRALHDDWTLPVLSEAAPQQLRTLRMVLDERLPLALEEAVDSLTLWWEEVHGLVGDPDTSAARAKAWRAALDNSAQKGFLVSVQGYTPDSKLSNLDATMRIVDGILKGWGSFPLGRRIAAISKVPWARLRPLREQLLALEATLQASTEKASTQLGESGSRSPVEELVEALGQLEKAARAEGEVA